MTPTRDFRRERSDGGDAGRQGRDGWRPEDWRSEDYGADWGPQRSSMHQSLNLYGDRVGASGAASPEIGAHDYYQHQGRGPRGYQRSDERIREDVCERLTDDPRLDASELEVSVKDCEVTLSGTVNSRQDKRLAEQLADDIRGVRDVHNRLRIATRASHSSQKGEPSSPMSDMTATQTARR